MNKKQVKMAWIITIVIAILFAAPAIYIGNLVEAFLKKRIVFFTASDYFDCYFIPLVIFLIVSTCVSDKIINKVFGIK